MYSSNASHSCEDQIIFLKSSKVGGTSHPTLITCRSVMSISPVSVTPPLLSPDSLCTSQRDHHGEYLTANSAPASTEIWLSFAFLKRWNTWRIREITSPDQQIWLFLSHSSGSYRGHCQTVVLCIAKSNGAEFTFSSLFVLSVWLACPCRHCSSERKFSERQTEIFTAGHTFNSYL